MGQKPIACPQGVAESTLLIFPQKLVPDPPGGAVCRYKGGDVEKTALCPAGSGLPDGTTLESVKKRRHKRQVMARADEDVGSRG